MVSRKPRCLLDRIYESVMALQCAFCSVASHQPAPALETRGRPTLERWRRPVKINFHFSERNPRAFPREPQPVASPHGTTDARSQAARRLGKPGVRVTELRAARFGRDARTGRRAVDHASLPCTDTISVAVCRSFRARSQAEPPSAIILRADAPKSARIASSIRDACAA